MSTTNVLITPVTSPKTPLATVEEPMSISTYSEKQTRKPISITSTNKSTNHHVVASFVLKRRGKKDLYLMLH